LSKKNFKIAQGLLWIGILSSAFAAAYIGGAMQQVPKSLAVLLSLLPGIMITMDKTLKHGPRSSWHSMYAARLRGLHRRLRDQHVDVSEVSKEFDRVESEMEELYPALAFAPLKSTKE
jgi:hypothetical protein